MQPALMRIPYQCEKDIRGCFAAGASRVSIDFTEGQPPLHQFEHTTRVDGC